MAFLESAVFPERLFLYGIQGGPGYATRLVRTISGKERRDQLRAQALHVYEVSHAAKLPAAWKPLRAFFHIAAGRENSFRFKDWTDYRAQDGGQGLFASLGYSTSAGAAYQMYKRYTSGSDTRDRRIQKPRDNSTVTVTGDTSFVLGAIDYTTGIVYASSGAPLEWVGDFDVPCRFDVDEMQGHVVSKKPNGDLIMEWQSIPIIEVQIE